MQENERLKHALAASPDSQSPAKPRTEDARERELLAKQNSQLQQENEQLKLGLQEAQKTADSLKKTNMRLVDEITHLQEMMNGLDSINHSNLGLSHVTANNFLMQSKL